MQALCSLFTILGAKMVDSFLVTHTGSCPPGSEWATYPKEHPLSRGVMRNPEMLKIRKAFFEK